MCRSALDALILGRQFFSIHAWGRYRNIWRQNGVDYYCAVGALMYGAFYREDLDGIGGFPSGWTTVFAEAVQALDRSASRTQGVDIPIQGFNDLFAETKEDVLFVYDGAIREMAGKLDG